MKLSFWEQNTFFSNIDIAIIGSGITGLSAAIELKTKAPKLNVVILEKGVFPSGASTRNAGFACFGSLSELSNDMENMGLDKVLELVEMRWKGLQKLKKRIGDDLGEKAHGGYELFLKQEEFEVCANQMEFFNRELESIIGQKDIFTIENQAIKAFGFKNVTQLILNKAESQINTGAIMYRLLKIAREKGVDIYNGIEVKAVHSENQRVHIETDKDWDLSAKKVLCAVNGFAKQLMPELKVSPARNQVLITQPILNMPIRGTFHYDSGYYYFRNVGNRILFGGGRNIAQEEETTMNFGHTDLIQDNLRKILREVILPDFSYEIDRWWSGILGVGNSKSPIVEMIDERIGVAVRLGGMGVAIGSLMGEQAAEMMME